MGALTYKLNQVEIDNLLTMIEEAQITMKNGNEYEKKIVFFTHKNYLFTAREIACHFPVGSVVKDQLPRESKWLNDIGVNFMCCEIYKDIDQKLKERRPGKY